MYTAFKLKFHEKVILLSSIAHRFFIQTTTKMVTDLNDPEREKRHRTRVLVTACEFSLIRLYEVFRSRSCFCYFRNVSKSNGVSGGKKI